MRFFEFIPDGAVECYVRAWIHSYDENEFIQRLRPAVVICQVEADRMNFSELCGYEVIGMAYPCGGVNYNAYASDIIRKYTGIKYARTIVSNRNFSVQDNLYELKPTVYHHEEFEEMIRLGKQFLDLNTEKPKIFYIWGHSYEFDIHDSWKIFEAFLEIMSGRDDICYCTNKEILLKV